MQASKHFYFLDLNLSPISQKIIAPIIVQSISCQSKESFFEKVCKNSQIIRPVKPNQMDTEKAFLFKNAELFDLFTSSIA